MLCLNHKVSKFTTSHNSNLSHDRNDIQFIIDRRPLRDFVAGAPTSRSACSGGKIIPYNPATGHRIKDGHFPPVRERFDNLRMDYIDKSHLIGDQRYSDRLTYDGTWENNLFNFIRTVLPKLTSNLPRPFNMEGVVRNDDTPQHKAVREAVTNMIIHADFMVNGLLRIEKYDDRIVLTNPGLLKLPLEQIYHGGESKARNQRMQNMFRMIGYGENLGSGFPLILNAWNEKHWLKPELQEQPELMQVKLTLHVQPDPINDPINGPINDPIKLTERQELILQMFAEDKSLSRERICEKTGLSDGTIKREIAFLKKSGYLERIGSLKTGYWKVNS